MPLDRLLHTAATIDVAGWRPDALALVALVAVAWAYVAGARALRRRSAGRRVAGGGQWLAFAAAMLALAAALASPLDDLAASRLSAHMAQHLLISLAAPPLLVLARTAVVVDAGLPRSWRSALHRVRHLDGARAAGRLIGSPYAGAVSFCAAMWLWHAPPLYDGALHHDAVHVIEHASMFVSAWLFWSSVVLRPRSSWGMEPLLIFGTMLAMNGLGALLTFSTVVWYPAYEASTSGLSPLRDQQLAGLIMWMPVNALLLVALLHRLWVSLESDAGIERPSSSPHGEATPVDLAR